MDSGRNGRTCSVCQAPHRNRSHNLCKECSKEECHKCGKDIKNLIERKSKDKNYCNECFGNKLGFGEYKEYYYRRVLDENRSYCEWVIKNASFEKAIKFKDWLRENGVSEKNG